MRKLATLVAALLVSSSAFAATPPEGVPLQVRRGFFTETDVGGIFTVGGDNGYSNLQTYLQLGLGYQLTINDGKGLIPIGFHVGIGANAQNCWAGLNAAGACTQSDNFTMTFLNLSVGYLHQVVERFYVGGKLLGGVTLLDPDPVGDGEPGARQLRRGAEHRVRDQHGPLLGGPRRLVPPDHRAEHQRAHVLPARPVHVLIHC